MDVRLPDINGYEATRIIKEQKPHLKIIAQTAYASIDEQQKAFNAGCTGYISKPTPQSALLALIEKQLLNKH
jgi:CheY-like chemotaxis protein